MSKPPQGSYPRQGVPYPTQQPVYPTQPNPMQYGGFAPAPQQSGQFNYGAAQYGMPPPPYSETQPPTATSGYNVTPQQFPQQYPSMAASGQYPTQQYPVAQYPAQAYPQNMVHGSFDPGARFHAGASVNIPPPPPGYAPNTAQAAASQGQSVNVQQRRAGWFSGGTDGGYTFW